MSSASDFVIENGVLKKYVGLGGDVVVPDRVKRIGSSAFRESDVLGRALRGESERITGVLLPEGVIEIGNDAFRDCRSLQSMIVPPCVKKIGMTAFMDCQSLTELQFSEGVTEIGFGAFSGCCSLTTVELPETLARIDYRVFSECTRLTGISIPNSVKCIDQEAFLDCSSLTDISIPESVTGIGPGAFRGCKGLADQNGFIVVKGVLFGYVGDGGELIIPEEVRVISSEAFKDCVNLTCVTISGNVTGIGYGAFSGCSDLESVTIPESEPDINAALFDKCSCVVKTTHWFPALATAVKDCDGIKIQTKDLLSEIPASCRKQALLGFVSEKGTDFSSERAKSYLDYAQKNAAKLCTFAFDKPEILRFLCEHNLIKAKDLDAFIAEAEKRSDTEGKALLLDYQNELGSVNVSKARAKKEKVKEEYESALAERISSRDPAKGIEGTTFAVTGKLLSWKSKDEIKEYLQSYGANLSGSITMKTDYLVVRESDSGSEKIQKAQEYGVPVISEEEFNNMIGKRFMDASQITVPAWMRAIPMGAFYSCKSLTTVMIPGSVTNIRERTFTFCPKVTIHAPAGSYAEQYAKENNIPFVTE